MIEKKRMMSAGCDSWFGVCFLVPSMPRSVHLSGSAIDPDVNDIGFDGFGAIAPIDFNLLERGRHQPAKPRSCL